MFWTSSSSRAESALDALAQVLADIEPALANGADGADPDLLVLFLSPHHGNADRAIVDGLRARWPGATLIGCTAGGTIGGGRELEGIASMSLTAAVLPDVDLRAVHIGGAGTPAVDAPPEVWHGLLGPVPEQLPVFVLLADPFSCDGQALGSFLDVAWPAAPKVGGLASGGTEAGSHRLFADDQVHRTGAVCLAMWGDIELTPVVAQGVRPLGDPMRVTRAQRNYVIELDGQPAVRVFQRLFGGLSERERLRFRQGPVVALSVEGVLPDTADRVPGPHEWLVRNLLGMDPEHGVIGVGGRVSEGQHLRFMIRDATAAADELGELLKLQQRNSTTAPVGALLFSCLGRGKAFFEEPDHDSRMIQRTFGPLAVSGFFCNGELGPVHGRTFLHGYTSSIALFSPRAWD